MSLLMDALKKAEQAKRQSGAGAGETDDAAAGDTSLSLQDIGSTPTDAAGASDTGPALPELPLALEALDAQFVSEPRKAKSKDQGSSATFADRRMEPEIKGAAAPAATSAASRPRQNNSTGAGSASGQNSARNVFEAKQQAPTKSRAFAIGVAGATLLAAVAIGGYFWWQLQPKSGLTLARSAGAPAVGSAAPAASASAAPGTTVPVARPQSATSGSTAPAAMPGTVPAGGAVAIAKESTAAIPAAGPASAGGKPAVQPRAPAPVSAPAADPDSPVRITRTPLRVNPALARAFQAYEGGDFATARKDYERVAAADPQNVDALGGLAAIALREGRTADAEHLYQRILVADPQDVNAISALAGLRGHNTPSATESRLKGLTASQPDAAAPYFALANLYATQERWHDAQQAYFKAHTLEPSSPDILYNLAISLEHLRQNRLAAQYYGMAVEAASRRPAGFDAGQAAARQRALQP